MENILELATLLLPAIPIAFIVSIIIQIIKPQIPEKFHSNQWFGLILNLSAGALAFLTAFIIQTIGWIPDGWQFVFVNGVIAWGLSVLGYEMVKNLWHGVGGDIEKSDLDGKPVKTE